MRRTTIWSAVIGDCVWFLACATLSSLWCIAAAGEVGVTYDEPFYLEGGLETWRTGTHYPILKLGTMPLPMDLATLPLYLWERTSGTPIDLTGNNIYGPLFWARLMTLGFWWLLLGYAWHVARGLAGPWGGRLAVAMLASEPSLLAHASLVTADLAITACLLAFVYHFRAGRDGTWPRRVGVPALWFGVAMLCKASTLAFGPLCMLAVDCERLVRRAAATGRDEPAAAPASWRTRLATAWAALQPLRRDGWQTLALGTALVFIYCGSDWQPQQSFLNWANSLPPGPAGNTMRWTAEHLRLFSNAAEPLGRQISHNLRGHGSYLLGRVHPVSLWYYFPVVLSMKLTLPLLILPVALALVRPRALANWACIAAGVLLVYTVQCRVQIGVRLVLPLVGIGVVGLAAAAVNAARTLSPGPARLLFAIGLGAGLAWSAASALLVWPHGICYVNELWGGTEDAYRLVSDGNYDWGQGLPELARWQESHADSPLDVWYYGTDPSISDMPVRRVALHLMSLQTREDVEAALRGRRLAVSMTLVYGPALNDSVIVAYLRGQTPAARTQTFLIYDFRE
jgi:hypothetical protein